MAVRDALLALLTAGPAYGFQLHGGLATRTGGRRAVNVGQTYATLERLTKQGLVEPGGSTDDGLPLHRLTDAGRAAARAWLEGADAAGADVWDETVDRVLIARSLPDWDAATVVAAERARWEERRAEASVAANAISTPSDDASGSDAGEAALARLAAGAEAARAEAALAWLDAVTGAERLAFAPRAERPKRGRRPGSASGPTSDAEPGDAAQASAMA
ncbi:PadR family transcriptional regulator [Agromyces bauzanensis]